MTLRTRAAAMLAAALLTVTGVGAIAATSAQAAAGCKVDYTVTNQWGAGFGANVTLTNLGDTLNGWTVGWTFGSGQRITQAWNGTATQSGASVSVRGRGLQRLAAHRCEHELRVQRVVERQQPGPDAVHRQRRRLHGVGHRHPDRPPSTPTPRPPRPRPRRPPTGTTPVAINGQLRVCGVNLCNQYGKPIQLRGISTHGLQWFPACYNTTLAERAGQRLEGRRLPDRDVRERGRVHHQPAGFTAKVNDLVDQAESRGMYAIVDFHTLTPGDPNVNLENAKTFFRNVATRNAAKKNVIYEIANEPNGVSWEQISTYANQVIPIIKAADPDAVILVGTRGWSSLGVSNGSTSAEIIANPLTFSNIMYTFHFYAASHLDNYRNEVRNAASRLPLFVSEWGTTSATGGGTVDLASSRTWLDLLDSLKISHVNWTYSDANESSAAFTPGTCAGSDYGTSRLTQSGQFVRSRIMTADSFPTS